MRRTEEELVLLATAIAMELARGLDSDEINELCTLINQILCSLGNLTNCKNNRKKRC